MMGKKNFQFEDSIAKLEKLVAKMEKGDLSLEESLSAFEQGMKLTSECQLALEQAEQKVNLLIKSSASGADGEDETMVVPFDADDDDDD